MIASSSREKQGANQNCIAGIALLKYLNYLYNIHNHTYSTLKAILFFNPEGQSIVQCIDQSPLLFDSCWAANEAIEAFVSVDAFAFNELNATGYENTPNVV